MKNQARILVLLATLAIASHATAEDQAAPPGNLMKKATQSQASKNLSAKALSKIGMDVTPSAPGARVYLIEPKDKAEVNSPVKVVFGLAGMGIAPAGTQIENTGHHHLLIDNPAYDPNAPLPVSEQIQHFGKGQTETTVTLKPGKHTLQIVLGDWKHQPHNPPLVSDLVTITVK